MSTPFTFTYRRRPAPLPAIPLDLSPQSLSILFARRSLTHSFLGDSNSSLRDALSALAFDPENTTALLQRADAHFSLGNLADADHDYRDLASRSRLPRRLAWRLSASVADFAARIAAVPTPLLLPGGLELDLFSLEDARGLMEQMKVGTLPPTPMILSMLERARVIHAALPNIVSIHVREIKVVGDTHGQFQDLLFIFKNFGFPSAESPYLFNGDYVDRGSQGVEIVLALIALKIADPDSVFLNRGNQYFWFG
jgi:hypothetical protein